ncbi:MAG: hypothetical protein SYC29_00180 [Planctomycetota bacterium]|nr:hypothetical protein [Planctomycetota bacterium]
MFGKLILVILTAAFTAAALLVLRQERIDTAHEMSTVHRQMLEHERALWELQCEIARLSRPEEIRRLMEQLNGPWAPIPDPESARRLPPGQLTFGPAIFLEGPANPEELGG